MSKGEAFFHMRVKTRETGGGFGHQMLGGNASVEAPAPDTRPWYGQAHFSDYSPWVSQAFSVLVFPKEFSKPSVLATSYHSHRAVWQCLPQ